MVLPRGGISAAWGAVRRLVTGFLIALVVGLLSVGVTVRTGHLSLEPVLSGSMQPTVSAGDVAVLWQVPTSSLKVGDVITFYPPGDVSTPKLHRIISLTRTAKGIAIRTKGDANQVSDPWGQVALRGAIAYRMVGVVPLFGYLAVGIGHFAAGLLLILAGGLLGLVALNTLRHSPRKDRSAVRGT